MITYKAIDEVTPAMKKRLLSVDPATLQKRMNPAIGRSVTSLVRTHLFRYNGEHPNKQGFPRSNYYAAAARATSFSVASLDRVLVSIAKLGFRLRYAGGKVLPGKNPSRYSGKPTRYLTVPAIAEAAGKRAGEFSNLKFALVDVAGQAGFNPFGSGQKLAPALVEKVSTQASKAKIRTQGKRGKMVEKRGYRLAKKGGRVYYWLLRSATHQPDPGILPTRAEFDETIGKVVENIFKLGDQTNTGQV